MARSTAAPAADQWEQLSFRLVWPEQRRYETIRPIVLFGDAAEHQARRTGTPIRTLYHRVKQFDRQGIKGLLEAEAPHAARLPAEVPRLIRRLVADYPDFTPHELGRICEVQLAYRPHHTTIQRILRETPPEPAVVRRFPVFHSMDHQTRRSAVLRLHLEGWPTKRIAAYLQTSRQTVHTIVTRFRSEDLAMLYPHSRARKPGARVVTTEGVAAIQQLRANPRLGAFRIRAALKQQQGIVYSRRTINRVLARLRALDPPPVKPPTTPAQPMPFAAATAHAVWSVDIRYLDMQDIGAGMLYAITILDNYSRAVLASAVSPRQDLNAYLQVLFIAVRNYGVPQCLVSDSGAVFRAQRAQTIYRMLGITKRVIARRQPWQNYIETMFNIQRRMADYHFEQSQTWTDIRDAHDQWVMNYNHQEHWAHQARPDGKGTPMQVLDRAYGTVYTEADLRLVFHAVRSQRRINRHGFIQYRAWRIYAEEGLAGIRTAVWLLDETLTIAYHDEPMADYPVTYQPDGHHFSRIAEPQFYPHGYGSPQIRFWEHNDPIWRYAFRVVLTPRSSPTAVTPPCEQLLFPLDQAG